MSIVDNRKATHEYFIEERFEAGLVLEGWEVKAIRAGHVQLKESFVIVREGELFIIGMHVSALPTASTHIRPDATRTRKGRIKLDFGLGRGKKLHDKRDVSRDKDWKREQERLMKHDTRRKTNE